MPRQVIALFALADEKVRLTISHIRFIPTLPVLFFFSGASSLIFETIFTRLLTYTFGNTAHATSTVLAGFLGGLALGAVVIGNWTDRRSVSLATYGRLELLIGCVCVFIPSFFGHLTRIYVLLYQHLHFGILGLTATRFALAGALVLVPTFLMGGTLPVIARYLATQRPHFQPELDRLYASNTLGAAVGVLFSTYVLMPSFGVRGTIAIACAINFTIFVLVGLVAGRGRTCLPDQPAESAKPAPAHAEEVPLSVNISRLLLIGSFLTGGAALGYEVVWTHTLSFLVGNTVYAFGLMLFTFLTGLGLGAHIVARRLRPSWLWPSSLAVSQVLVGVSVFVTLPLWFHIPDLFAYGVLGAYNYDLGAVTVILMARITYVFWTNRHKLRAHGLPWYRAYEPHIEALVFFIIVMGVLPLVRKYEFTYFVAGELLRLLCVFGLLIVPALLMGLSFPLLLNLLTQTSGQIGGRVGRLYALNTVGSVAGSIVVGFVLLPHLGSLAVLRGCAALNILLGLIFAHALMRMRALGKCALSLACLSAAAFVLVGPVAWDMSRITGTYAYFNSGWRGDRVVFLREDVQGGLTSVVQTGSLRTLLSNGKFQGDNFGEVPTQTRFAMIPALFTRRFDRALVIGLGTGGTLRTVARFPFRKIDAVELSPQVAEASRQWFEDVNDRVFDRDPRVTLSIADGRNFLLLSPHRYDMITIEVTSLWISGEADLYNKEFYELCRSHLAEHGVLQQWVALHHLRTQDLLVVLNTAAQVFPHVAFFQASGHGLLIASSSPLEIDYRQVEGFDKDPRLGQELTALGIPSAWSLLGEMALYGSSFHRGISSLPSMTGLPADFSSTDFRPYLEYRVPKGITLLYDTTERNIDFLQNFGSPGLPPDLGIRNLPSENERRLILGYVAQRRGDSKEATAQFGRVEGSAQARAQTELARLNPGTK